MDNERVKAGNQLLKSADLLVFVSTGIAALTFGLKMMSAMIPTPPSKPAPDISIATKKRKDIENLKLDLERLQLEKKLEEIKNGHRKP